jgi:thiol:disulfide interchange protein
MEVQMRFAKPLAIGFVLAAVAVAPARARQVTGQTGAVPAAVPKFDPKRDAANDINGAVKEAKRTGRRVILDVGGEWCGWCHTLDRYFVEHDDLRALRDQHYVWLKVNYSPENTNAAVLGRYPGINGYPHLFVLDQDGTLVQSQDTSPLEEGSSYNYDRMKAFLLKWTRLAR